VRLLVTDVVMPGLGGHALAERLRAQRAGLPVLFMSGYAVPDEPGGGPAVAPLLAKPFTAEELLAAVGEAAGAAAR
jgi:CheY-like chemotaxis protein